MPDPAVDVAILDAIARLGLIAPGEAVQAEPLTGGVSSDIWKVTTGTRVFCVKRALAKLKVAQEWRAPVARSRTEYAWLEEAGRHAPASVPRLLGYDETAQLFALEWLDPADHHWWKGQLRDGIVDPGAARAVGTILARIHSGTAGRPDIAATFATDEIFHAIRLEPYLLATAQRHPDLGARLSELAATTARTRIALVHGDVSPKNILIGPQGPVLLDAECAWYGDPAFDVAFCLNHLLLKGLWNRSAAAPLLHAFAALADSYAAGVNFEDRHRLLGRIADLLPGLLLARVDGKSPVEYLTDERDRALVREVARGWLGASQAPNLAAIREGWAAALRIAV